MGRVGRLLRGHDAVSPRHAYPDPARWSVPTDELWTPARAEAALATISHKGMSHSKIKAIVAQLRAGTFDASHGEIVLNLDGGLLDGRHRLSALLQVGTPVYLRTTRSLHPIQVERPTITRMAP